MVAIKAIQDLNALGYTVLHMQKSDQYLVLDSYTLYNPDDHIFNHEFYGIYITLLVSTYGANFKDEHTIRTTIEKEKRVNIKAPNTLEYVIYTPYM